MSFVSNHALDEWLCCVACFSMSQIMSPLCSYQFHRVIDIHFNEMSCRDFELKSLFETDPNECVHYNAMGAICGCPSNEPHPEACGPLVSTFFHDVAFSWRSRIIIILSSHYLNNACSVEKERSSFTMRNILFGIPSVANGI